VACGAGTLEILELKPEGRAALRAVEWARGARLTAGETFETLKEISA
jgi:methionyl-tRNA formyltransferase